MSPVNRIFVNQTNKPNIVLFPNPISTDIDLLTIKILGTESLEFDGFIYNQFGNYVLKIENQSTISNSTIKINELSNGLYLIKLTDGYNLYSTKFIIQK